MDRIYFDNSATTRVDPRVVEAMLPYFTEKYGNPSSLHSFGREAYNAMEEAREKVAKAVGAAPRDIVFTSGGTESDNIAIQGASFANQAKGKHIVTTAVEHHAVLHTCQFMETQGFKVSYLQPDSEGTVTAQQVEEAITPETVLISIMAANNEIGTLEPIKEIGEIAKERKIAFHSDAVQAITKERFNVDEMNVDLMAISAHKFHGPKGVGALYLRKGVKIRPVVYGGGHERGIRSSTENVSGMVGMGRAIEIGMEEMAASVEKMTQIRDHIIDGVLSTIPQSYLNGPRRNRLCNNAHFRFDFIEGEGLVLHLDMKGIATSTGSACSTKSLEPSHVLRALGLKHEQCHGSLRVSLSRMNTTEEADYFLETLPGVVTTLRKMSPLTIQE